MFEAPFDHTTNRFNGDFAMHFVHFCCIRHTCGEVYPMVHYLNTGFTFDTEPLPLITDQVFGSYGGECPRRRTRSGRVLPNLAGFGGGGRRQGCHRCISGCQDHNVFPFCHISFSLDLQYIWDRRHELWSIILVD